MGIKHDLEKVQTVFSKEGYTLISEYENFRTNVNTTCPKGHIYRVSLSNFNQGNRCTTCSGRKKYTIQEIQEMAKNRNEELLSTEYKNNIQLLTFRCPNGHEYKSSLINFRRGHGCPIEGKIKASNSHRRSLLDVKKIYPY